MLTATITATASATDVAEQQKSKSLDHDVVSIRGCVHAAASIVVPLHIEKPCLPDNMEVCRFRGCVQLIHAECKLNAHLRQNIASLSASSLEDVGVADNIGIRPHPTDQGSGTQKA